MRRAYPSFTLPSVIYALYAPLTLTIIFLPIPILILAAINISWLVHLPSPVRHAIEEGLGSRFIGIAIAGLLGSVFWLNMFLVLVCVCPCANFDSSRTKPLAITFWILCSVVFSEVSWIVYLATTPWHPESKIPPETLSAPTVLTGCRQILALKCMIVIELCFMAIWILILFTGLSGAFNEPPVNQPRPSRPVIPSNNHAAGDGAFELPAQGDPGKRDLEAGEVGESEPDPKAQKQDTISAESSNMATMDGAE